MKSLNQRVKQILDDVGITHEEFLDGVTKGPGLGWWQREDRKCRGVALEVFIPDEPTAATLAKARGYCIGCPVRRECLYQAIIDIERVGVFGGESERRRRILRKWLVERRRAPAKECPAESAPSAA